MRNHTGIRTRLHAARLALLCLCAFAGTAGADALSLELGDWVRRTEAEWAVNPLVKLAAVAANPTAYRATRAVRVNGRILDIVPAEDPTYVYVSLESDCGMRVAMLTWRHTHLVEGSRLRAVLELPRDASGYSAAFVALAWAPEAVFTSGQVGPVTQSGAGATLLSVQPGTNPHVASGPRTIQGQAGGSSTYYGVDQTTGLPYYGPTRQETASANYGATSYQAPTSEALQYQAYCNLVRYCNQSLSQGQVDYLVRSLFEACAYYGVPRPLMAALIHAESRFNPTAKSPVGAQGLTQLMPGTARGLGVTSPYDIRQNIWGGTRFFADMLRRYASRGWSAQVTLGIAAYNAGPGAVDRAGGVPNYRETIGHVRKVTAIYSELYNKGYR